MNGVRQHKEMAMGKSVEGEGGNFGVAPFSQVNGGGPTMSGGHSHEPMGDHERGVGKHISRGKGMMGAQAAPDHGPHDHNATFGVQPFKSMNG